MRPMRSVIQTLTSVFDAENPHGYLYTVGEIAHALGNTCRFNGHCKFYSVAEHCVLLSHLVPQELAKAALLHDAEEAYFGDIVSPFKRIYVDDYGRGAMDRTRDAIMDTFRVSWTQDVQDTVDHYDLRLLNTERQLLYKQDSDVWQDIDRDYEPFQHVTLRCLRPECAGDYYLGRFRYLWNC